MWRDSREVTISEVQVINIYPGNSRGEKSKVWDISRMNRLWWIFPKHPPAHLNHRTDLFLASTLLRLFSDIPEMVSISDPLCKSHCFICVSSTPRKDRSKCCRFSKEGTGKEHGGLAAWREWAAATKAEGCWERNLPDRWAQFRMFWLWDKGQTTKK